MKFKEWIKLQETGTSTASIAGFSRISIPMVKRTFPGMFVGDTGEDPFFKKLRNKKKKNSENDD